MRVAFVIVVLAGSAATWFLPWYFRLRVLSLAERLVDKTGSMQGLTELADVLRAMRRGDEDPAPRLPPGVL